MKIFYITLDRNISIKERTKERKKAAAAVLYFSFQLSICTKLKIRHWHSN
jgi:hypothetical protein